MPIHDKSPRPQEFAAVDLGSKSFHMVIARVVVGAMQIMGRLKQRVHLAVGLGPDNMLSEEAMTRGLNCLSLFAERLQGFSPASVCIVGTHTLRQALMVIARVVDGAMQIIGRLKQRVHLADGLGPDNMLSEEAMTRGLNCLSLFAERLQGSSPASVCIVGTHTLRQALNATVFLKRAEKVIPYPIEIISGNEEARLIFMGVEHTQPEKGRKLVIDIGGGSTLLVIGEYFEAFLVEVKISNRFSLKAAGWVVSALPSFISLAGSSIKRIFSALAWRQHKNWKL